MSRSSVQAVSDVSHVMTHAVSDTDSEEQFLPQEAKNMEQVIKSVEALLLRLSQRKSDQLYEITKHTDTEHKAAVKKNAALYRSKITLIMTGISCVLKVVPLVKTVEKSTSDLFGTMSSGTDGVKQWWEWSSRGDSTEAQALQDHLNQLLSQQRQQKQTEANRELELDKNIDQRKREENQAKQSMAQAR